MKEKLETLIQNAKTPYFNFPVACILECYDGRFFEGVNVETSSPASGICAERNALFSAITAGYKASDFKRLYLLNTTEKSITPCFICRQALIDYCLDDLEIISYSCSGQEEVFHLKCDLCPHAFTEEDLK